MIALQVLQKAQSDNEVATKSLSDVLAQWQLLQDLLQGVVGDLNKADNAGVLPILQELDIQSAQNVWTQLEQYAMRLMNGQGGLE